MKINAIQNQNPSFGKVREIWYDKNLIHNKLMTNLNFENVDEMRLRLQRIDEFKKRIADLKAMKTNLKELLDYDKLKGNDRKYAEALLSNISDKEKEDLTVDITMDGRKAWERLAYLTIKFPKLYEEWGREEYLGPKYNAMSEITSKEDDWKLDSDIAYFYGMLPVPRPNVVKKCIKSVLLQEGEKLYKQNTQ